MSLDISEVFKPVIVYRTIFELVNNRRLQVEKHFDKKVNYCLLNEEGRKIFIEAFSNDECVVKTIYKMLFPDCLWINRKYHGDSYLKNWLMHVACLLRGTA